MAGVRKFLGGVVSGALVAGLTLVVVSQISTPRRAEQGIASTDEMVGNAAVSAADVTDAEPAVPEVVPAPEAEPAPEVLPAPESVAEADGLPEPEITAEPADVAETVPAVGESADPQPEVSEVAEPAAEVTAETDAAAVAATGSEEDPGKQDSAPEVAQSAGADPEAAVTEGATVSEAAEAPEEAEAAEAIATQLPDTPPATPQVDPPAQTVPGSADAAAAPEPAAEAAGSLIAQLPMPLAAPVADGAPVGAELPPPPPLTAEELAILADAAQPVLPAPDTTEEPPASDALATGAATTEPAEEAVETAPLATQTATEEGDVPSPIIPGPTPADVAVAEEPVTEAAAPEALAQAEVALPETLVPDAGLAEDGPSTLPSTPRLITANEGSLTDRDAVDAAQSVDPEAALPEVALEDVPALKRFAESFENTDRKPLFGILLIDRGEPALDRQAVAALPFPVSIVIDPLLPEAAAYAALYRAGGKEVVMLATGIPEGATPADVEQTFQAHEAVLPEAVAVIDGSEPAFQNDRPLSTQIVPILAAQGRGLLTWDKGLNAADQVARREGLPTAMVFRQIDAEGESVPVMRRYLDRAAFRAAQEGKAIVIGSIQPETIAALLEWAIEGRASTVALAPASALLGAP